MALAIPPPNDRKRVKVYELKDNDWFDRGTGFCTGQIIDDDPRILVESEDQPERMLLETKISREDRYQKQQETLIVWTDSDGTDMALSFQEPEGCAVIWDFVRHVQQHFIGMSGGDDVLSDDALDSMSNQIMLPHPELGSLPEIEHLMRAAAATQAGRDAVSKYVIRDEYIMKLLPLVTIAEDLESLPDLHRLCNIMKSLILLNDNTIIEQVVSDNIIIDVVGALEYDPDFPTHKANHRQYLNDRSRYKEVVPIKDPLILRKIRHTWRLQYLKDVVLARILDDPTFSVLNSLIFFNQVDILQHLQSNTHFLNELFALFNPRNTDNARKEDAVQFIHQCGLIAKNLQAAARASLFGSFISHGLFSVIAFAVKHPKPALRTTGVDIIVALLDHDPIMMRGYMLKAVNDKKVPLTDTLIDLLHTETDLGVKNQLADAIKVLLDPQPPIQEALNRAGGEYLSKLRVQHPFSDPFVQNHFDESARRLFAPLKQLESRPNLDNLTFQEAALFSHLVDILTFFVRQHIFRSRNFMHADSLAPRVAQLLTVQQKHLKLTALKFFRTLISLQDTFYHVQMTHNNTFELILNIVYETMPRDNLLNSACLELFEHIKRENIKPIIIHIVENYREKLKDITYVDTFQNLILRYDQMQGYGPEVEATLLSQDGSATPTRNLINGGQRWHGVREMDAAEEEYFDASDDEEDEVGFFSSNEMIQTGVVERRAELMAHYQQAKRASEGATALNGSTSSIVKPLVDYPDDDDDAMEVNEQEQQLPPSAGLPQQPDGNTPQIALTDHLPLERLSEKRRREEDEDDDELVKLSSASKRRGSTSSTSSVGSIALGGIKMKRSFSSLPLANTGLNKATDPTSPTSPAGPGPKKIAFNLSMSSATALKNSPPQSPDAVGKESIGDDSAKDTTVSGNDGGGGDGPG